MIKERPNEAVGYRIKGELAVSKGDKKNALNAFKRVVEINPGEVHAWAKIFSLQLRDKAFPDAEQTAEQLVRRFPLFPGGYFAKGIISLQLKNGRTAESFFQKVLHLDERYFRAHNYLGLIKTKRVPKEAIRHFEASLSIAPRQPFVYFQLGRIHAKGGETEKGLEIAKRWGELFPDKGGPHSLMSDIFLAAKQKKEAITHLVKAISLEPRLPSFYINLGSIYEGSGEYMKAVHVYEDALSKIPNHPILMGNLAWSYAEMDRTKKARSLAEAAEKMRPNDWGIKDTVGWIYYKEGNYEAAIRKLKEAIMLNDHHPTLQYHIALAYLATDKKEEALKHLKKADNTSKAFPEKSDVKRLIRSMAK